MARPSVQKRRLLIVGNGMATDRLLDELGARGALDSMQVTVVGEEPTGAYNRVLLSHVLDGAEPDEIVTKPADWYVAAGVELISGRWVQRLDTARHLAYVGNGETIPYDLAVLATGSTAVLPPLGGVTQPDGSRTEGVHLYRSMEDCLSLREQLSHGTRNVVVVGGGLLGLEVARIAEGLGHRTTVVHPLDHLVETQLDQAGGQLLRSRIESLGIPVVVGRATTVLARPGADGRSRVEALLLEDEAVLDADAVVFCVGVRPRIEVGSVSGIEVDRGVVVDEGLATSAPDVFAIGECAQLGMTTFGLVAPCWDQAIVLAELISGSNPAARYEPAPLYVRLKVAGIDVTSLGALAIDHGDEVVQILETSRGVYRRLVVRNGRLAGAIIVGDTSAAPTLIGMLERGTLLPQNRLDVFCTPDAFRQGVREEVLCHCNRVSRDVVTEAIAAGVDSVEEIGWVTRAGTGCGSCVEEIGTLLGRRSVATA